ncbi:MAG: winged helix-turn-helix domain-containing protein [Paludibacter sp.]
MTNTDESINTDGLSENFKSLLTVPFYNIGKYTLDIKERKLVFNNEIVKLSRNEFLLMLYFAANPNITLDRSSIMNEIWSNKSINSWRSLDVYLCKMRKLLKKDSDIVIINIHGKGFKMIID